MFQRFGESLREGGFMLGRNAEQSLEAGHRVAAGPARRVAGEVAQSVGKHYAHKGTLSNLVNPLGGAVAGIAEGTTRAAGKELVRGAGALGASGGSPLAARALGKAGVGMQRAAKPLGLAGEVAGLAGLGTAIHAPVSLAGALGGQIMGGVAHAAPAVGDALHHAGAVLAHGANDVVGSTAQAAAGKARGAVGKALWQTATRSMPPPAMMGA